MQDLTSWVSSQNVKVKIIHLHQLWGSLIMAAKALRIKFLRFNNCTYTTSALPYSVTMQHKTVFKHSTGRY